MCRPELVQPYDVLGLKMVKLLRTVANTYTTMQVENTFDDNHVWNGFLAAMQDCLDHLAAFEEFLDQICRTN